VIDVFVIFLECYRLWWQWNSGWWND